MRGSGGGRSVVGSPHRRRRVGNHVWLASRQVGHTLANCARRSAPSSRRPRPCRLRPRLRRDGEHGQVGHRDSGARSRGMTRVARAFVTVMGPPGSMILCLGLILESLRLPNLAWPSKRRGACRIVACGRAPLRNGVAVDTRPLSSQAEGAPLSARQALRAIFRLRMGARCCSA